MVRPRYLTSTPEVTTRLRGEVELLHLASELVKQPLVIVVAEGEQLAVGVQDAAVAGTGQPGRPPVADQLQAAPMPRVTPVRLGSLWSNTTTHCTGPG
jgi:hypothetical protein